MPLRIGFHRKRNRFIWQISSRIRRKNGSGNRGKQRCDLGSLQPESRSCEEPDFEPKARQNLAGGGARNEHNHRISTVNRQRPGGSARSFGPLALPSGRGTFRCGYRWLQSFHSFPHRLSSPEPLARQRRESNFGIRIQWGQRRAQGLREKGRRGQFFVSLSPLCRGSGSMNL